MDTDFSLSNSYVTGGNPLDTVKTFANKYIGGNSLLVLAIIIALVLVVIWLAFYHSGEHFNPTQTLRMQKLDGLGFERLDPGTSRSQSVFAQDVQTAGGASFTIDPTAAAGQPGSMGYQILHSADFDCDNRKPVGSNAWDWMTGVAKETLAGGRPKTDSDFSKVLAGH